LRQPRVGRKCLEQGHDPVEKVDGILCGLVVHVARRLQGADAGAVLLPLMLPEFLVGSVVGIILPVCPHVLECGGSGGLEDLRDVRVGARGITAGVKGAIALNSLALGWTPNIDVLPEWLTVVGPVFVVSRRR
jgi:hypothetical protein